MKLQKSWYEKEYDPAKLFSHTFQFDKVHPTQKPTELIRQILVQYSKETNLVCDSLMVLYDAEKLLPVED